MPTVTREPMPEWAIRMDEKLNIVLRDHTDTLSDHETRLRAQEAKSTVSPTALYTACLGALMAATGLAAIIIQILK